MTETINDQTFSNQGNLEVSNCQQKLNMILQIPERNYKEFRKTRIDWLTVANCHENLKLTG